MTISAYTESLLNSSSHFKALDGIFAIRDTNGDPIMFTTSHTVCFEVEIDYKHCIMKCFINDDKQIKALAKKRLATIQLLKSPFLIRQIYIPNEMLTFDSLGQSHYNDIMIQEMPDGTPLDEFLLECLYRKDRESLLKLLSNIVEMSKWLSDNNIVHKNIKPSSLIITHSLKPVLIHYDALEIVNSNDRSAIDQDNASLALVALIVYICAGDPESYKIVQHRDLFKLANAREILPEISNISLSLNLKALFTITDALLGCDDILHDRELLNRQLTSLVAELSESHIEIAKYAQEQSQDNMPLNQPPSDELSIYDEVFEIHESARRVMINSKYLFLDNNNNHLIDTEFDYAEDFNNGRAVITLSGYAGMIDNQGIFVLPPHFDELVWLGEQNITIGVLEGKFAIYSREGKKISKLYDYIGDYANGLIPAASGEHYGYIRTNGTLAIPMQFDNAYSFDYDGTAVVEIKGNEYLINEIGEILGIKQWT